MQGSPRVHVDMAEVRLQPDMLAHTVELLVDEHEVRGRAGGRSLLVHSCSVHDAVDEAVAAEWECVAEDRGEKGVGEAVESGDTGWKGEAIEVFAHDALHLVFVVFFRSHGGVIEVLWCFGSCCDG